MHWALVVIALVVVGVVFLLSTMRAIHGAQDEDRHYRLSARFWGGLAVLGVLLVVMFVQPLLALGWLNAEAGILTAVLLGILPAVVIFAGLRNWLTLVVARRRRATALGRGVIVSGTVIDRSRRTFAQDLIAVTVEADLPLEIPSAEMTYRARDLARTKRHRFVETCPGDHWSRLEPGRKVRIRYLPQQPASFAVLLFD